MVKLRHSPALDGAFTHKGVDYRIDDGIITVEDESVAREMAEHRRIELVEVDETPTPEPAQTGDNSEYPTNDDGEPLCDGKEDGQCSRTVDELGGSCWQHPQ
jgi:hypothetical protein